MSVNAWRNTAPDLSGLSVNERELILEAATDDEARAVLVEGIAQAREEGTERGAQHLESILDRADRVRAHERSKCRVPEYGRLGMVSRPLRM